MLIDSENLIARIDKCYQESAKTGLGLEPVMAIRDIKALISVMQTVDAAPVKHGRWTEQHVDYASDCAIDEIQEFKCSVCGLYHTTPYMYNITHYKFCPNCGAKMDLEEQDAAD